jgi:hypothetical protein
MHGAAVGSGLDLGGALSMRQAGPGPAPLLQAPYFSATQSPAECDTAAVDEPAYA